MALNKKAKTYITTAVASLAIYGGASLTALCASNLAYAAEPAVAVAVVDTAQSGAFEKSTFKIKGDWQIVKENS